MKMGIKIEIGEGESIHRAIRILRNTIGRDMSRRWTKRRYGYYEKPSVLRRKEKKMRKEYAGLRLKIGMSLQHARTGPNNAAGR
ncbi:30S ribosomal protein S21 [bacterium AH-315-F18]|nr:30S ribosomal protein S21 [bacterium AH-315-F18]